MSTFLYRARDAQGLLVTGTLEAVGDEELKLLLADRGLIPVSVRKSFPQLGLSSLGEGLFQKKVDTSEVLVMTRQFYTLFKAGMSMEAIFGTLVRQTNNKRLKEALQRIRSSISSGSSLSKSFEDHKTIFGELYMSMLAAGEEAGILEEVLNNLSQLIEKEMQIKSSVTSATLYPKIVIFVLMISSVIIMTFVIPKFASFYGHYKAELPLPTRIMIGTSDFLKHYWYVGLGLVGMAGFFYRKFIKTNRGRLKRDALKFKMPVFGDLNLKVANARFCHILSALYRSGLPMTRCLEITGGTIENMAFMREVEILKGEVIHGKMISEGMASCHYFSPVIVDATAVGEQTGSLDEMLESMGNHYDLEVQHTIKNLTTLLEPFLLFVIFRAVTMFTLAIFLPIWNMSQVVGH